MVFGNLSVYFRGFKHQYVQNGTIQIQKYFCSKRMTLANELTRCPEDLPPMNVMIAGANSEVGQMTAFFLKQSPLVHKLILYDRCSPCIVAEDLDIIPTSSKVEFYHGKNRLPKALRHARVLVVCGGHQKSPGKSEENLFRHNADYVRQLIMYCAAFNPYVHICIATPPIGSLVPMVIEESKKVNVFNSNRVYGLVTTVMKSKGLSVQEAGVLPKNLLVIGGERRRTAIPILSQCPELKISSLKNETLTRNIQESEEDALSEKLKECNRSCCYLSISCAIEKFILSLMKGINGENVYECVYMKQKNPMKKFARYLTTLVKLEKCGVTDSKIPKLSDRERTRLKYAIDVIRDDIFRGETFITGEDRKLKRPRYKSKKKPKLVCSIRCEDNRYRNPARKKKKKKGKGKKNKKYHKISDKELKKENPSGKLIPNV